jgi:hypothetical protein
LAIERLTLAERKYLRGENHRCLREEVGINKSDFLHIQAFWRGPRDGEMNTIRDNRTGKGLCKVDET